MWMHWSEEKQSMMPCAGPGRCRFGDAPHASTQAECDAIVAKMMGKEVGDLGGTRRPRKDAGPKFDTTTLEGQQAHDIAAMKEYVAANKALDREEYYRGHAGWFYERGLIPGGQRNWQKMPTKKMVSDLRALHEQVIAERGYDRNGYGDMADKMEAARVAVDEHYERYRKLDSQYAGWSRFFLTNNTNGHIHSSMECSTCNRNGKRTQFEWLPELSGLNEQQAIQKHGPRLCTTCFPDAPLDWTNGGEAEPKGRKRQVPEGVCPGSGSSEYDEMTMNEYEGYRSVPGGTMKVTDRYVDCPECGKQFKLTAKGVIRKHKIPKKK